MEIVYALSGRHAVGKLTEELFQLLHQPQPSLPPMFSGAGEWVRPFLDSFPSVRAELEEDLLAALAGDPAAASREEVQLCYPGYFALAVHRMAHRLHTLGVPLLSRAMAEYAHSHTGIDIHPGAVICPGCFIDHGTGVVIGETAVLGRNVRLYHGVTLGARATDPSQRGQKRHPTIEDGVTIFANATVLGGDTVIGRDSIIGAGAFVTSSLPPGSRVRFQA